MREGKKAGGFTEEKKREENMGDKQGQTRIIEGGQT